MIASSGCSPPTNVRFGSLADICSAKGHVRLAPNSDHESGFSQKVMSALPLKADMCGARGHVCFGPIADIASRQLRCPRAHLDWSTQLRQPRALAVVQSWPHIASMATTFPPAYELTTRPCTIHAGRYRWVITANGKPVSTSGDSFETPELARMDGLIALERLVHSSRINE
jgi:hypothetical protein